MKAVASGTFRQSMSWLHTWAGLLLGWVLYFIFITGSAGYFNKEITHWMQPEAPMADASVNQQHMLVVAEKRLHIVAPDALEWWIDFPIGREYALSIWWQGFANKDGSSNSENDGEDGVWKYEVLNPQMGEPVEVRETGGGSTLYVMHYALHYIPRVLAYWITSLCAMFMLVGLITGIVIHKKIFKDFFTFRPGKKQRSWLDMHNVLSVLPLPFHLMITYSGLLLLMFTTMEGMITASYGTGEENRKRFYDTAFSQGVEHKEAAGISAKTIALVEVLPDAERRWGKNRISYIGIENRGDINAHIELGQYGYKGLDHGQSLTYNAVNGALQHASGENEATGSAMQLYNVMESLHEGQFASIVLRWLYFLSGLMGAGMVATGMILWAAKRREKAQKKGIASRGLVLVERLNVGTVVGLPIAIAVYFWANRLIPAGLEGRADWEIHSLFIAWAIMLVAPFLLARKYSLTHLWVIQLTLATVLYALLPILNALTTNKHLGVTLRQGDWVMVGFDISMWGFALCFGFAIYQLRCKVQKQQYADQSSSASVKAAAPIEVTTP